ncbi:MAG: flagellar brake protein [Syntrophomonadaceae bacterium]|nr:flagellar brake protein [Syntrophomonadaceae bacterium]MDD3897330.1 flagellar brake protein [Syntrophomonadaceae bacterium]MDD4561492.1 flagellar brake protein [Syntrophomonadaceae bacterium]
MNPDKLRVNQLVEIELNEGDASEYFPSRIEEIKEKYLYISMPMRKGALLPMRIGQEIKVIMRHRNSTVGFLTKVVGRRREPIPYLIITKPERIVSINQKREYVRLSVSLPVRFRVIDEEGGSIQEGVTIDISAGGALFSTQAEVKAGQKIEIEIQLSPEKTFSCHAHAIRIFERDKTDKNAIRVAIEYDGIGEGHRDRIFRFIFEKQREWLKKGIT